MSERKNSGAVQTEVVKPEQVPQNGLDTPKFNNTLNSYEAISKRPFSVEAQKVLSQPIDPSEVLIKPDGIIYAPGYYFRKILLEAFKPGGWGLVKVRVMMEDNNLYFEGLLFVDGAFVATAIGEQKYIKNNRNQTYATALEGAKTDCLTRCCKDIGIAMELWNPVWVREWKKNHALMVWGQYKNDEPTYIWRRKDLPLEWPYKELDKQGKRIAAPKVYPFSSNGKPSNGNREQPTPPENGNGKGKKAPKGTPLDSKTESILTEMLGNYKKKLVAIYENEEDALKVISQTFRKNGLSSYKQVTHENMDNLVRTLHDKVAALESLKNNTGSVLNEN